MVGKHTVDKQSTTECDQTVLCDLPLDDHGGGFDDKGARRHLEKLGSLILRSAQCEVM